MTSATAHCSRTVRTRFLPSDCSRILKTVLVLCWSLVDSVGVSLEDASGKTLYRLMVEDSRPSLSLQINLPVLSLSLSVLLILATVFLFLAFRRGAYRSLKAGCFSSEEPPHIIYEIRMRRPVQENIYTLD
ncbi:hypothetical protein L3Q82_006655 [Scortum barcoo]|uniref:Uncharacterized protein n=1 Tax=Scortum barcoo TaxID=214431 RepID=A0ACB8X331_9TELE|nr:hypothetical protein L3Q82_006655 [Scortum barcoo]